MVYCVLLRVVVTVYSQLTAIVVSEQSFLSASSRVSE